MFILLTVVQLPTNNVPTAPFASKLGLDPTHIVIIRLQMRIETALINDTSAPVRQPVGKRCFTGIRFGFSPFTDFNRE